MPASTVAAMEITEAVDHGTVDADGESGRAFDAQEFLGSLPSHSRDTLLGLARLIDGQISGARYEDAHAFARRHLKVSNADLVAHHMSLPPASFKLICRVLGMDMKAHSPVEVAGHENDEPPVWTSLQTDVDTTESIPEALVVSFAAGTAAAEQLVVAVDNRYGEREISVFCSSANSAVGEQYLASLLSRARGECNVYRGRCLRASATGSGIAFSIVAAPVAARSELVLPDEVWEEVRVNVDSLFDRYDLLTELGLGTNRGLLLAGPPGTGKTQLCKVLAAELVGKATVVFADASAMAGGLNELYDEISHLGSALVVLEDVDLVVGHRDRRSNPYTLNEFLTALDGVWSRHSGVVTVATTNDKEGIDKAARRAARFDSIVEVPLPEAAGRSKILRRYLDPLGLDIDVVRLAEATEGLCGADLRELVRRAVLEYGASFTTEHLLTVAGAGKYCPSAQTGQYL